MELKVTSRNATEWIGKSSIAAVKTTASTRYFKIFPVS